MTDPEDSVGTFEFVYLDSNDDHHRLTDSAELRWVDGGALVRLTKQTVMFVPDHRILCGAMPVKEAFARWGVGRSWLKEARGSHRD